MDDFDRTWDDINVLFEYSRSSGKEIPEKLIEEWIEIKQIDISSIKEEADSDEKKESQKEIYKKVFDLHSQLAKLVKPVTSDSIRYTKTGRYFLKLNPTINLVILIATTSLILFLVTQILLDDIVPQEVDLARIETTITQTNTGISEDDLDDSVSTESVIDPDTNTNSGVTVTQETDEIVERDVTSEAESNLEADLNSEANAVSDADVNPETDLTPEADVNPDANAEAGESSNEVASCEECLKTYNIWRNIRGVLKFLNLLSASALGTSLFALNTAQKYIRSRTFEPRFNQSYIVRILMGIISGTILGYFGVNLFGQGAGNLAEQLGPALLAIVGGYSAKSVLEILERITEILLTIVRGSNSEEIEASRDRVELEANIERVELEARQRQSQENQKMIKKTNQALTTARSENASQEVINSLESMLESLMED
ncbi:MAG: hypothetical protein AAFY76_11800 [Cyanobacteria bacterium J06649_11]